MYCGICGVSLTIALGFVLLGFWLILPFAGLELVALAVAFYLSAVRVNSREVISIRGGTVAVQKGLHQPEESTQFQRAWARVELAEPQQRGYPTRLLICSHGRKVEIGHCLNDTERRQLAVDLRRWIRPPCAPMQAA